jgi:hypothetical protein
MSQLVKQAIADAEKKYGPAPQSFTFGDGIDWNSPVEEAYLYVELPFWLMIPPGPVDVLWSGVAFTIDVCSPWIEEFAEKFTDSRVTCLHQGPLSFKYEPPEELAKQLEERGVVRVQRDCKTVLRLKSRAHLHAFRPPTDSEPPRARVEQEAYWASLCEAHIPVVNELIQRYRLKTYDYFAYEVSAWDVPIWYLKVANMCARAVLLPYKSWDTKPVIIEDGDAPGDPPKLRQFEWTTTDELSEASSSEATPGEFDLLDARSLMERGDYTGAVRRTVTAIEAALAWALLTELAKLYDSKVEAVAQLRKTDNNFPRRLSQWRKLANPPITQREFDRFGATRQIRHDIVHRARRLTHDDRGLAQFAVDTGRWLFNKIEAKPDRARLRDYGVLKSVGRVALAIRFPATLTADGYLLGPFTSPISPVPEQGS